MSSVVNQSMQQQRKSNLATPSGGAAAAASNSSNGTTTTVTVTATTTTNNPAAAGGMASSSGVPKVNTAHHHGVKFPKIPVSATATGLKLRLQGMALALDATGEELGVDRDALDEVKAAEKSVSLDAQAEEIRKIFAGDVNRIEEDFRVQVNLQRAENVRIQQALNQLKVEKTAVHQQLLAIQRRIEAMEEELGHE
jgi:hypothetical protein